MQARRVETLHSKGHDACRRRLQVGAIAHGLRQGLRVRLAVVQRFRCSSLLCHPPFLERCRSLRVDNTAIENHDTSERDRKGPTMAAAASIFLATATSEWINTQHFHLAREHETHALASKSSGFSYAFSSDSLIKRVPSTAIPSAMGCLRKGD